MIVPAHNAAATLEATLGSVWMQEPRPDEVVVAADRCTDRTVDVARSCGAIVLEVECGNPGGSRNAAVGASSGDLLFFLDADDLWLPGKIAAHLAVWEAEEVAFVFDRCRRIRASGEEGGASKKLWSPRVETNDLFDPDVWASGSCASVRKRDFEAVGGFVERRMFADDVELLWQLSHRRGPGYQLPEIYTQYIQHPAASSSLSAQRADVDENIAIFRQRLPWASGQMAKRYEQALLLNVLLVSPSLADSIRAYSRLGLGVKPGKAFSAVGLRLLVLRLRRAVRGT